MKIVRILLLVCLSMVFIIANAAAENGMAISVGEVRLSGPQDFDRSAESCRFSG